MTGSQRTGISACRRRGVSCGACCGPFNLDFEPIRAAARAAQAADQPPEPDALPADLPALLNEREREFLAVDFSRRDRVLAYRRAREDRERAIPRHDPGIYVCPFFGPVPPGTGTEGHARPGCMIHPLLTGDPTSQNYSFYGASICQGYDCANKEADASGLYAQSLAELFADPERYARLMGDVLFHKALRKLPGFPEGLAAQGPAGDAARTAFAAVCSLRLNTAASRRVTSFELSLRPFAGLRSELEDLLLAESENDPAEVRAAIDLLLAT